jgi:hypothetical protein
VEERELQAIGTGRSIAANIERRHEAAGIISIVPRRYVILLASACHFEIVLMLIFWSMSLHDPERLYFDGRKWSLDFALGYNDATVDIRHWQTVNTNDVWIEIGRDEALIIAIAPLAFTLLYFRRLARKNSD